MARRIEIQAGDILVVEANPENIESVLGSMQLEFVGSGLSALQDENLQLSELVVPASSRLAGRSTASLRLLYRYGVALVGVSREAEQGADQVSRFCTGTNLRMCTSNAQFENAPEGVLPEEYWRSMKGHHGTFRLRYDKQEGKRYGTLTVRMVWHELTYKDVEGFEDEYLIV